VLRISFQGMAKDKIIDKLKETGYLQEKDVTGALRIMYEEE
jgi:hypothetical protein